MSDKCPYCSEVNLGNAGPGYEGIIDWSCGTSFYGDAQGYSRGCDCYEAEISAKTAMLERAADEIGSAIVNLPDHKDQWPCHCRSCAVGAMLEILHRDLKKSLGRK